MDSKKQYATFAARVPESFKEKVEEFRKSTDMTKSELMRCALREYMENHERKWS